MFLLEKRVAIPRRIKRKQRRRANPFCHHLPASAAGVGTLRRHATGCPGVVGPNPSAGHDDAMIVKDHRIICQTETGLAQSLLQIGLQIVHMLDADR
jgi:hypothetical protein